MTGQVRVRPTELLQLLVESVVDYAIFVLDPEGNVVTWNSGAQRIKGWTQDEIVGRHFSIFYPPDDIAARKPWNELAVAAEAGRVSDEGWRMRKDGSRFWADVVITALRDRDGELVGFAKVTRDLTERMNGEESRRNLLLIEQRDRLANTLLDGIVRDLFAVGLSLQALATVAPDTVVRDRLSAAVDELDSTIGELRGRIFRA